MLKKVLAVILILSVVSVCILPLAVNASGQIFSDDFDGNSAGNGWSEINNETNAGYGVSVVKSERSDVAGNYALNLKTPKFNRSAGMNESGFVEQYGKSVNYAGISDYTITFNMKIQSGQYMGIIVGDSEFYNIQFDFNTGGTKIYLLKNQKLTMEDVTTSSGYLAQSQNAVPLTKGTWHKFEIKVNGSAITVSMDNAVYLNYALVSTAPECAKIGFYAGMSKNTITDMWVDNVKVSVTSMVDSSFFDGADFYNDFTMDTDLSQWDYGTDAVEITENGAFRTLRLKGIMTTKVYEAEHFEYRALFDAPTNVISLYCKYADGSFRRIDVSENEVSLNDESTVLERKVISLNSTDNIISVKSIGGVVIIKINSSAVIKYSGSEENGSGKFAISSDNCIVSAVAIAKINYKNEFSDDFENYTASGNFDDTDSPWTTIFDDAGEQTNVATNTITGYHLSILGETGPNYVVCEDETGNKMLQMKNASINGKGASANSYIRTGDNTWSDYTYHVDVKSGNPRSEFMFIMFRISDKKKYYALSLNSAGKLEFCKNATYNGGSVIATGLKDFSVTVKAVGRYIAVYLNEGTKPAFEYFDDSDTPNLTGGVGFGMLSGWDKPESPAVMYFDNVSVELSQNPFAEITYDAEGVSGDVLETGSLPKNSNGISIQYKTPADFSIEPVVSVINGETGESLPYTVLSSDEQGMEIEFTEQLTGGIKCNIMIEQLLLTDNTFIKNGGPYTFTVEADAINITEVKVNTDAVGFADVNVQYAVNKNQLTNELIVVALYKEGKMVKVQAISNLNPAGDNVNVRFDIDNGTKYTAKVYCWDSITVRNAVSETVSVGF